MATRDGDYMDGTVDSLVADAWFSGWEVQMDPHDGMLVLSDLPEGKSTPLWNPGRLRSTAD
jgi:hypothetical protein